MVKGFVKGAKKAGNLIDEGADAAKKLAKLNLPDIHLKPIEKLADNIDEGVDAVKKVLKQNPLDISLKQTETVTDNIKEGSKKLETIGEHITKNLEQTKNIEPDTKVVKQLDSSIDDLGDGVKTSYGKSSGNSAYQGGSTSTYSGEEWCRYFRETYGADNVAWVNATPSQLARSWQGTGKYIGIDDYVDTTVPKGTILYRGEPNGTEYFTTLEAIEGAGRDAKNVFEGLQVKKDAVHGYRGEMQGYIFKEEIASAYGITNANPQFGKGGLPQYFVPDTNDYIQKGILVKADKILLKK